MHRFRIDPLDDIVKMAAHQLHRKASCSPPPPAQTNSKASCMSFKLTGAVILADEG
jgi:hypothetical protein